MPRPVAVEVIPQGAAGTKLSAVVAGFDVAAIAVEVVGDVSAGRADGMAVGVRRSRQQAVLEALWADAPGVDGVEVADVAEPAFGPAGRKSWSVPTTTRARAVVAVPRLVGQQRLRRCPRGSGSAVAAVIHLMQYAAY